MMDKSPVTIQLPASLYAELQTLAADEQTDPVEVIRRLVAIANQRHAWRRDLTALREIELRIHGNGARYFLRSELRGCSFEVLKAAGVAVPPSLRR